MSSAGKAIGTFKVACSQRLPLAWAVLVGVCSGLIACSVVVHPTVKSPALADVAISPSMADPVQPMAAPDTNAAMELAAGGAAHQTSRAGRAFPPERLLVLWPGVRGPFDLSDPSDFAPGPLSTGAGDSALAISLQRPDTDNPAHGDLVRQPCCREATRRKGNTFMMWLLAWRYLWVVALALLLTGWGWLLLARRKGRPSEREAVPARSAPEGLPYFALPWDGDAGLAVKDKPVPGMVHERRGGADSEHPVPNQATVQSPLAAVFNTLSSPGGSCARLLMGNALSGQEPIIRAAVGSGDGRGVSFKLAGVVEWPLWARLHHGSDAAITVAYPAWAATLPKSRALPGDYRRAAVYGDPANTSTQVDATELVDALEDYLSRHSDDRQTQFQVGASLFDDAQDEPDESIRAGLLEGSIRILRESAGAGHSPGATLALARACLARALIGPVVDEVLLIEAEESLRSIVHIAGDTRLDALWELQKALQVVPHGWSRDRIIGRLSEAETLLDEGLAMSPDASAWQGALLRAQLKKVRASSSHGNECRLRLRALHAQWSTAVRQEASAEVLAPWVELLCAIAEPLSGHAASDRYDEAQAALRRMLAAGDSRAYAQAWSEVALGRSRLLRGKAKATLLAEADTVLQPYASRDDRLRLQACKVALVQAQSHDGTVAQNHYQQVVELGRPLTGVPTFAMEALRYVLTALLALGEEKERRVYAKCLEIMIGPEDGDSLLLLAECHLKTGDQRAGCVHAEMAWRAGAALPPGMIALWQAAHATWPSQAEDLVAWTRNRNCLRMVTGAQRDAVHVARW